MTLLGQRHCMRECCESYYFMFHNIIFISVFFLFIVRGFSSWKSAGRWWHVHTKNRNEGFMALSVKLFLGYFSLLFHFSNSLLRNTTLRCSFFLKGWKWKWKWRVKMDFVACAASDEYMANEWMFTIMMGIQIYRALFDFEMFRALCRGRLISVLNNLKNFFL